MYNTQSYNIPEIDDLKTFLYMRYKEIQFSTNQLVSDFGSAWFTSDTQTKKTVRLDFLDTVIDQLKKK